MSHGYQRAERVAERIHQIIARRLERGLKDPRLGFLTITDVRVTGDLQQATVFFTVYGSDADRRKTVRALRSAKGLLRSEVGKALGTRLTPQIAFVLDQLPEEAEHLNSLLAKAQQRDEETKRLAAGASYAGEADPYQKPRDEELADDKWDSDFSE